MDSEVKQRVVSFLRDCGQSKAAWRLENCRAGYIRIRCAFCGEEARVRFTCNVRVCSECVREQSKVLLKKMMAVLLYLDRKGCFRKGWSWKLLTLTTRAEGTERWRVGLLKREFHNLWHRYYGKVKGAGCFYAIELGSSGNVHLHAVMYVPFREREELKRYWEKRTGAFIVDIRSVRFGLHQVVAYVVKYVVKEAEGDAERLIMGYMAMFGRRRVGAKGLFYGVKVVEEKLSICAFCFQSDGWIVVCPFRLVSECGVPVLTRTVWSVEFG
jgi:hypothetical protein